MQDRQLRYDEQAGRVAALVEEIRRALAAEDFARLIQLGNRLATDSVIARALATEVPAADGIEHRPDDPAQAA